MLVLFRTAVRIGRLGPLPRVAPDRQRHL